MMGSLPYLFICSLSIVETTNPSITEWFSMAKNVVEYANSSGIYDELEKYINNRLKTKKMGFL